MAGGWRRLGRLIRTMGDETCLKRIQHGKKYALPAGSVRMNQ